MTINWSLKKSKATLDSELLENLRAAKYKELIDFITSARASVITIIPGQEMIYQAKEAEAERWMSEENPDIEEYPLLAAEIGITAPDAYSLAQLWLNMSHYWRLIAAQLEAQRLTINAQIANATTIQELENVKIF